jgi:alcohol dehydrogenase class IV
MANIYKNTGFDLTTTDKTDVYTVPANRTAVVKTIQTTNSTGSNVDTIGYIYDSSATTEYEIAHHTLGSKDSINFIDGTLVLESGDISKIRSCILLMVYQGVVSYIEIFDEKSA